MVPYRPTTHKPEIVSLGLFAYHSQSCAVIHGQPAVLDMNTGVFQPSWEAQEHGWRLVRATKWWQRLALRMIDNTERGAG